MLRLIIFILLPVLANGQQNLVPNGGFELFNHCPNQSGIYSINALDWTIPNPASPDYYNVCALPNIFPPDTHQCPNMGVPANVFGYQPAHSGDAYIGIYCFALTQPDGGEYIQVQLADSIVPSIRYQVSFYASLADNGRYALATIGAYLSKEAITNDSFRFDVIPQILNPVGNPLTDPESWVLITDTFSSRYGGERYLTIGNFNTSATSDTVLYNPEGDVSYVYAYYYIDDVSVIALDSLPSGVGEAERLAFSIYPNPAADAVSFNLGTAGTAVREVRVWDAVGREVLYEGTIPQRVNISHLPPGLFMVQLTTTNGLSAVQPLVISRP
jgi:hypothetical protein